MPTTWGYIYFLELHICRIQILQSQHFTFYWKLLVNILMVHPYKVLLSKDKGVHNPWGYSQKFIGASCQDIRGSYRGVLSMIGFHMNASVLTHPSTSPTTVTSLVKTNLYRVFWVIFRRHLETYPEDLGNKTRGKFKYKMAE